jgi:hypothetical protein
VSEPEDPSHHASIAVWDLASPVVIGHRTTLKAGIACPSGCNLTGSRIDIHDETGTRVGGGEAGAAPWPATSALYWAQLEVDAPETEGEHSWSVRATAPGTWHTLVSSVIRFIASRPPEHRVTFEVIEKGSGVPLAGVELRLGTFRAVTNDAGIAHVDVPGGTYEACAWKIGCDLLSTTAHIAGDDTIRLQVTVAAEPEQPYWM